jgi:hypothetical protein
MTGVKQDPGRSRVSVPASYPHFVVVTCLSSM